MSARTFALTAAMMLGIGVIAPTVAESAERGAWQRLLEAVELAWRSGTAKPTAEARAALELAESRSETVAGTPALEIQAEGIGGGFDERPNSARYLRLVAPLTSPWAASERRRYGEASEGLAHSMREAARMEAALEAISTWLRLATATELEAVHRRQLELIDAALVVERKRVEVGEAAGAELTQFELERLRLRSELAKATVVSARERAYLLLLAGDDAPMPALGDLHLLCESLPALPPATNLIARREASPRISEVRSRRDAVKARGEHSVRTAWGDPALAVEWESVPEIDGEAGFDALGLLLSVPLPVGKARQLAKARASAAERLAETELRVAERAYETHISARLAELESLRSLMPELLDLERRIDEITRSLSARLRLGGVTYLEFLDGLGKVDEIRTRGIELRFALLSRRAEMATMTGSREVFPLPESPTPNREDRR